jgi:hypothetical protein
MGNSDICLLKYDLGFKIKIDYPHNNGFYNITSPNYAISFRNSNVSSMWYSLNYSTNVQINQTTGKINQTLWNLLDEGLVNVTFSAINASDYTSDDTVMVYKDITPPTTSLFFIPHDQTNIVNQSTRFTLNSTDNFGILKIQYRINDSDWIEYSGPFNLLGYPEGDYEITFQGIDKASNRENPSSILIHLVIIAESSIIGYNLLIIIIICFIALAYIGFILKRKLEINRK